MGEKIFLVYYYDDYPDNGGVGLHKSETCAEAIAFIETRMREDKNRKLDDYQLFQAFKMRLEAIEQVTRVRAVNV